ncbi:MAG TPA: hypothetical protein VFQ38_18830 [Longimicrobiales bacterium]|nr:hypothetical protein [Longimicrobiales bacterium]
MDDPGEGRVGAGDRSGAADPAAAPARSEPTAWTPPPDMRDQGWSRIGCVLLALRQIGCMLFIPAMCAGSLLFLIGVIWLVTRCT